MLHLDVLQLREALTPAPGEEIDPDIVTPGVIGFALTIILAVGVVFLIVDMVRRLRRINHRAAVNERLDAEEAAAREAADD